MGIDDMSDIATTDYLVKMGLKNPARVRTLIKEAIQRMELDLTGMTVLTEAASKNFVVTPIIAALAGAEVYAITKDSRFGAASDIKEYTMTFAKFCSVEDKVNVIFERNPGIVGQADIITNLGFVRPIDKALIDMMGDQAVIPYMYEAWEFREGDLDLEECKNRGIPVMATNEDAPKVQVFDYVGPLCGKLLNEMEIEVLRSKILLVSKDKFGPRTKDYLESMGAEVTLVPDLLEQASLAVLKEADVLVIADIESDEIIGDNGDLTIEELKAISPGISILQYIGGVDAKGLMGEGYQVFPEYKVGKYRMAKTLADLGPKPVIDLHTAGLKVGEILTRKKLELDSLDSIAASCKKDNLVQVIKINSHSD